MANQPETPEKQPKKLSKGVIIGIIVGVVAVIGIVVAVIMMNSSSKPTTTNTATTTTTYPDEPGIDPEVEARNKLRANDLAVVAEAVKKYQAESETELPGPNVEEWQMMINRYIPEGVKDGATGETYSVGAVCKFGESCVDTMNLTYEANKNQIFALYNADCKGKTKENVIVSSTRKRRVAIFAIVEGEQFICTTN